MKRKGNCLVVIHEWDDLKLIMEIECYKIIKYVNKIIMIWNTKIKIRKDKKEMLSNLDIDNLNIGD